MVFRVGYIQLEHHLITGLVDRWRPETSTFHLRVGEMTITLGDVACLLGIPIDGAPLTNPDPVDYLSLCQELLGLTPPAEEWWGDEMIQTIWFRQ